MYTFKGTKGLSLNESAARRKKITERAQKNIKTEVNSKQIGDRMFQSQMANLSQKYQKIRGANTEFDVSQMPEDLEMFKMDDSDWENELAWYDTEYILENSNNGGALKTQISDMRNYEEALEEKHLRREKMNLKQQERYQEQNQWELQKMGQAGLFKINNDGGLGNEDQGIMLEVKDPDPEFLRNRKFKKTARANIKTCKDPTSDMALLAKNGSAVLKRLRETNERGKIKERFWELNSGGKLGNLLNTDNRNRSQIKDSMKSARIRGKDLEDSDSKSTYLNTMQGLKVSKASDFSKSKSIREQREYLPVFAVRKELMEMISNHKIVIVVGETGSGKTTQLTQYLMEDGYGENGIIGCTQPRRVAAVSVASRVSQEVGCSLGDEVGYSIRFEDCCTPKTKIKYMTDGVLLRESLNNDMMEQYSAIIMDEAHERSLNTDVLFGLLKRVSEQRRDLKVIITSATMDSDKFSRFFNNAPVFNIPGRTFPVEIRYSETVIEDYVDKVVKKALEVHISEPPGDILVFMTGQEDIEAVCFLLADRLLKSRTELPLRILPIYSEAQTRIFQPSIERKCIVATNIAETSLTLDGVKYVIDSGFCKIKVYNPRIGMDALQITPISQANADQRSGRAGRTGPGKCFRVYRSSAYREEMLPNNVPEIQRTNLSNVVLLLKSLRVDEIMDFDFMDPPPEDTLLSAMYELWVLGALDQKGRLTQMGRKMAEFPLAPNMSRILLVSERLRCSEEALTIVAMLSVPKIFSRPKNREAEADAMKEKLMIPESDHLSLYNVYKSWQDNSESSDWSNRHFIQNKSMKKVKEVRGQLRDIMISQKMKLISCDGDLTLLRRAVCSGYFSNAARIKTIGKYRHLRTNLNCALHPSSALFLLGYPPDYVVYHELLMTSQEYMLCVTTVDPLWLAEFGNVFYGIKDSEGYESMFGHRDEENKMVSGLSTSRKRSFVVFKYGEDGLAYFSENKNTLKGIGEDLSGKIRQNVFRPGAKFKRKNNGEIGFKKSRSRNYFANKFVSKGKTQKQRKVILEVDEEEEGVSGSEEFDFKAKRKVNENKKDLKPKTQNQIKNIEKPNLQKDSNKRFKIRKRKPKNKSKILDN